MRPKFHIIYFEMGKIKGSSWSSASRFLFGLCFFQGKTEADENIHYGEIDFSTCQPEASSDSVKDSGQQEETLYTQVKVSKPENS